MSSLLTTRRACPIGIDFSSSGAKLVQLKRGRNGFSLIDSARIDMPLYEENELPTSTRLIELCDAIKRTIESGDFIGRKCVVSVENRFLRVRSVRQPAMPPDELQRAIALEAHARLGFGEGEEAQFGWLSAGEVTQGEARGQEIILIGSRTEPIQNMVLCLARRGLITLAVEPSFVGCARSFSRFIRRASEQHDVHAVVDIGLHSTGVMLLRGNNIAFYKPLEFGGEKMAQSAAERLGLDIEAVRELRLQQLRGRNGDMSPDARVDRAIFEGVRPLIGDLAREVALCLRYYSVTFRGSRPRACLVVGGEAATPHLVDVLGEELRIETRLGESLRHVRDPHTGELWQSPAGAGGEWAVATGLGLRFWEQSGRKSIWQRSKPRSVGRETDGVTPRVAEQQGREAA